MRRRRDNPAVLFRARDPLPGIAQPGYPLARQLVIAHIGPVSTLAVKEAIQTTARTAGWGRRQTGIRRASARIIAILRHGGRCSRLLHDQAWIVSTTFDH